MLQGRLNDQGFDLRRQLPAKFPKCRNGALESTAVVELLLNLGWVVLAAWMVVLWLRRMPRAGEDRRAQFVALALVILILLPAISMTDDLIAARNPAEVDVSLRRDHTSLQGHIIQPAFTALVVSALLDLAFEPAHACAPGFQRTPILRTPVLASIENRPPPAA